MQTFLARPFAPLLAFVPLGSPRVGQIACCPGTLMGYYLLPGGNTWKVGQGKQLEQYRHFETVSWIFFFFFNFWQLRQACSEYFFKKMFYLSELCVCQCKCFQIVLLISFFRTQATGIMYIHTKVTFFFFFKNAVILVEKW